MALSTVFHSFLPPPSVYPALGANDQVKRFISINLHYITFHEFSRQLSAFWLCSSGLISALLVLSTVYLFMKVSPSPDITLCGWLGLKHQLTNCHSFSFIESAIVPTDWETAREQRQTPAALGPAKTSLTFTRASQPITAVDKVGTIWPTYRVYRGSVTG